MEPHSGGGPLVLIAEDEPDNREIMRAVVEDILGYRAVLVADGVAAVETALRLRPDLVLMDLMMPALDGFQAIKRIKSSPATGAVPVVAVTALSRPADRLRAVQEGADDYISKPFDLDMLVSVIERHTARAQQDLAAEPAGVDDPDVP